MPVGLGHVKQSVKANIIQLEKMLSYQRKLLEMLESIEGQEGAAPSQKRFDEKFISHWIDEKFGDRSREKALKTVEVVPKEMLKEINPYLNKRLTFQQLQAHINRYFDKKEEHTT